MSNSPTIQDNPNGLFSELAHHRTRLLVAAAGWLLALNLAVNWAVSCRQWGVVHDAGLMHYIAWRISEGDRPYVDLFDMNGPGTYLLHWAVLALPGDMDLNWRLFDLLVSLSIVEILARFMRPAGRLSGVLATLFVGSVYLSGGFYFTGQRDWLLAAFQLAGCLILAAGLEAERMNLKRLLLAGVLFGMAATIKPHAIIMLIAQTMAVLLLNAKGSDSRARLGFGVLGLWLGAAVPWLLVLGWLGYLGSLDAYFDIVMNYLLPYYSQLKLPDAAKLIAASLQQRSFLVLVVCAAVLAGYWWIERSERRRAAVLIAAALAGLLQFAAQRKDWSYHQLPFFVFGASVAFWHLGRALRSRDAFRWFLAAAVALSLIVPVAIWTGLQTAAMVAGRGSHMRRTERIGMLIKRLEAELDEGDTVQTFGGNEGCVDALLRLKVKQPTRFIYDFHFYMHPANDPYIAKLRAELLAGLRSSPPRCIVIAQQGLSGIGVERLESFPELSDWLQANYELVAEEHQYRLLRRREPSPEGQ